MKKNVLTAAIFWCFGALVLIVSLSLRGADQLYDSVIRLHVLANSDAEEDQAVKLLVRDRVLSYCREELSLTDRQEAEAILTEHLDDIQSKAKQVLTEAGRDEAVSVTLSRETYPTRQYDDLALPCGTYTSLKISIGAAKGKNWWCVLFPPLCLDSAATAEDALLDAGMSEENVKTVTLSSPPYEIRFRIVEWIGSLREKFKREI